MTEEHERDYKLKRLSPRRVENLAKELFEIYKAAHKPNGIWNKWERESMGHTNAWRAVARHVLRNL